MKQEILKTLKIIVLALVVSVGIAYAGSWTAPSGSPSSTNNTPEPINVGISAQVKDGGLGVDQLCLWGAGQTSTAVACRTAWSDNAPSGTWCGFDGFWNDVSCNGYDIATQGCPPGYRINSYNYNDSGATEEKWCVKN